LQSKGATLGDVHRVSDRLGEIAEQLTHLIGRLEMPLRVEVQEIAGEIEMGVMPEAGENIGNLADVRRDEERSVSGDDRQTMMLCERAELADGAFFSAMAMALQFNENVIRTEDADQLFDDRARGGERRYGVGRIGKSDDVSRW
jgi:hypothetical protein